MEQKQNYRNLASRFIGYISNISRPGFLVNLSIYLFCKFYRINLNEYEIPKEGFCSFNDFFTRKIKKQNRPLSDYTIISPVDGYLVDFGIIDEEKKIYVKHKYYFIEDLISNKFQNVYKSYAVFYLAPYNYHRVHVAFTCEIEYVSYFPGTLYSLRQKSVMKKENVFCRNERIVIYGKSAIGEFCLVMVGAMIVGKVKLSFDKEIQTNIKKGKYFTKKYFKSIRIEKGEELGLFELGSTVILLMNNECLSKISFPKQYSIKMGEGLFNF